MQHLFLYPDLFPGDIPLETDVVDKIIGLIGEDSQGIEANMGRITSISPMFVLQGHEPLIYRPNEFVLDGEDGYKLVSLKPNSGEAFSFLQTGNRTGSRRGRGGTDLAGHDPGEGDRASRHTRSPRVRAMRRRNGARAGR